MKVKRVRQRENGWDNPPTHDTKRILVPVADRHEAEILLPLAHALARSDNAQLLIVHVVAVPADDPLSAGAAEASRARQELEALLAERGLEGARVRVIVRVARDVWEGIWETIVEEHVNLMILAWASDSLPITALGDLTDPRLASPPCDLIIVRPGPELRSPDGWKHVRQILLPVRGGPHAAIALRVANALAEATNATITLLHVTQEGARDAEERLFANFAPALKGLPRLTRSITIVGNIPESIIAETPGHQVVVMGASARQVEQDQWMGPILETVVKNTDVTLIIAKECQPEPVHVHPWTAPRLSPLPDVESPPRPHPIAVVVDKWFAENTFHSREFQDLERLLQLKEEQGLTISLGLPALNEEETVGKVITTVKSALMDRIPLLDEIVLIDSGSVDYTREIAADLGIPVYIHQEVLTQYGAYHGKGEALWKSLYILNGDIIAWIDTDIKNIHPRFVYGILGPLLKNPRIQYVKGFYRRPLREGNKIIAGGGGRVTELTARPLLNLFFPELSGLIQPLAGEYAGRREALERLPFFTGYGVETGLLIDMLEAYGLQAIAQVDLLERVHHNQPLPSLSKMAFAIIQVVVRRLEDRHKIRLLEDINKTMNLIRYGPNRYFLETVEIREHERPPMITIPEYREKRGLPPLDNPGC